MKQHRKGITLRKVGQTRGKFFVCLGRYQFHRFKAKPENMIQTVYKGVAMFLTHVEASCMIRLQRALLVGTETPALTTTLTCHLILGKIIIMCFCKRRKQQLKLGMSKARQAMETRYY
jgi:hypothetical protein